MKINDLYGDVLAEDAAYEFKAALSRDNPVKWAKTIVAYANGEGGTLLVGVSDNRDAFGLSLDEVDKAKNLVAVVNDRHIFPHARVSYSMRSVDAEAERFVLGIRVSPSDSVVRYREGDFNETVYVKGDGNSTPATPEQIISLAGRKRGVDNAVTDVAYDERRWTGFMALCREFRGDGSAPGLKELQSEEVVSKDGFARSGLLMFMDGYDGDETLVCCRLWKGTTKAGVVLDSARAKGSLGEVLKLALAFVERNTKAGWAKTPAGGRAEVRSYPPIAVREALVNAVAHRDYSIAGTQIDVDIFDDRIDVVSPGSWLLPMPYEDYPIGSIPSIRRNTTIAACLDVANLMERGGTGFQAMVDSYAGAGADKQPVVMAYPGFLDLRLFDLLYEDEMPKVEMTEQEVVVDILRDGPRSVRDLQSALSYASRSRFLKNVINPLIDAGAIYRDGPAKSPTALMRLR